MDSALELLQTIRDLRKESEEQAFQCLRLEGHVASQNSKINRLQERSKDHADRAAFWKAHSEDLQIQLDQLQAENQDLREQLAHELLRLEELATAYRTAEIQRQLEQASARTVDR